MLRPHCVGASQDVRNLITSDRAKALETAFRPSEPWDVIPRAVNAIQDIRKRHRVGVGQFIRLPQNMLASHCSKHRMKWE